jgi:hypothetical protein
LYADQLVRLVRNTRDGSETAEYFQLESFFGLMRKDGMCCISAILKPLLDARLDVGEGYKKGDLVVVNLNQFRTNLAKFLDGLTLETCLNIRNRIESYLSSPVLSTGTYSLSWSVLLVWILDSGCKRLKQFNKDSGKREAMIKSLSRLDWGQIKNAFSDSRVSPTKSRVHVLDKMHSFLCWRHCGKHENCFNVQTSS